MPRLDRDVALILAAAFVRAVSVGMIGVLLGIYLAARGLDEPGIGYVVAAGLCGMACGTAIATFHGDRLGRRRSILAAALLSLLGGALAAFSGDERLLAAAAFLGMLNGQGRDRGAAMVIEQAALPGLAGQADRTRVFAWYNVVQDGGGAVGSLLGGLPSLLRHVAGMSDLDALRASVLLAALLCGPCVAIYALLSPRVEPPASAIRLAVSPASRGVIARLCGLSAMDSFGGGFLTTAMLTYWFARRFGVSEGALGLLFAGSRLANAASHLGAAWLAARIGLVNTMVFTHIPSSLLLMTVPFAPSFGVAVALFILREGLVEMDVPTRQSYTMAVVRPEERTFASGITTVARVAAWSASPSLAGLMMRFMSQSMPIYVGAGIKIAYDVLLYASFRKLKPPEER